MTHPEHRVYATALLALTACTPENLDTLGFVPGIELDFELTQHWHLVPFAQAGRASDLQGGSDATVYSFGAEAEARRGAYLFADYFADRPDEPLDKATESASSPQFEAGLTIGPRSRFTVWRIPVPRLGIGYRFGEDLGVWRLAFGQPF